MKPGTLVIFSAPYRETLEGLTGMILSTYSESFDPADASAVILVISTGETVDAFIHEVSPLT